MLDYKTILRMHYQEELGSREISASMNCGKTAVNDFLSRFEKCDVLSFPLPPEVTNEKIEELLYQKRGGTSVQFAEPEYDKVYKALTKKGQTLQRLWNKYRRYWENTDSSRKTYSYRTFCQNYKNWLGLKGLTGKIVRYPGQNIEVDFAGMQLFLKNPVTGKDETKVTVFVSAMSYSKYYYAEGITRCRIDEWLNVNTNMLRFYHGVTPVITNDNCKVAVIKNNDWIDPVLNKDYKEWAEHYNTTLLPARVRHPDDKPNVEGGVRIITENILVEMQDMIFYSLEEFNKELLERINDLNAKPFSRMQKSRKEIFESEERDMLLPLPSDDYIRLERKLVTVAPDCHITFDYSHYSVPYKYMKQQVEVRASSSNVSIYNTKGSEIYTWKRSHVKGAYCTNPDHLPAKFSDYNSWSVPYFIAEAQSIGLQTRTVIETILNKGKYPCQYFRQCVGILNFAKKYSKEALESCCSDAIKTKRINYTFIKNSIGDYVSTEKKEESEAEELSDLSLYALDDSDYSIESLLKKQEEKNNEPEL